MHKTANTLQYILFVLLVCSTPLCISVKLSIDSLTMGDKLYTTESCGCGIWQVCSCTPHLTLLNWQGFGAWRRLFGLWDVDPALIIRFGYPQDFTEKFLMIQVTGVISLLFIIWHHMKYTSTILQLHTVKHMTLVSWSFNLLAATW